MMSESPKSYSRRVVFSAPEMEIVECEWQDGSISALHGHGWSKCSVVVKEGRFENLLDFGVKTETAAYGPGDVMVTPVGVRHELRCVSAIGKTLHVYSPRIQPDKGVDSFVPRSRDEVRDATDLALTEDGLDWASLSRALSGLERISVPSASPQFMNQLFAGVFPTTLAAVDVVARNRTTLATFEASPAFTSVELEVIEKLGALIGWSRTDGIGVPGGSSANFMALHCARQRRFPNAKVIGLDGRKCRVFVSSAAHYSMKKACVALGFGSEALVTVSTDEQGRMRQSELSETIEDSLKHEFVPLLVCATAGSTVYGAFDPIAPIADICANYGIWLHVDGAWGAPVLFSKRARALMEGVERADSLTFDAHKLFGAPLTSSFFLTRHHGLLEEANDVSDGEYLFHSTEVTLDRGRLSWQCGRGADALSFWCLWKSLGSKGMADFVDRLLALRDEFVAWIRTQDRLELISEPSYLNICVRVKPAASGPDDRDWSRHVREQLRLQNAAMVNYSRDARGSFLRLILAHPSATLSDLAGLLSRAQAIV